VSHPEIQPDGEGAVPRPDDDELRQANKLQAVGRLAAGVAHDFNNMLMVILGHAESLLAQVKGEERRSVEQICAAAERAAGLTRHLLAFTRGRTLQPEILAPNAVIAGMRPMLRPTLPTHVDIVYSLSPTIGHVEADAGQLEQLLLNLVVNACDAMPRGGKIVIETANEDLDDAYAARHVGVRPGSYVRLSVSDTGHGMDAATRERIFEPFFTTKPGKGTGLGLSTAYGIVKQHGGNIWVYSEPDLGTTFKIYLPRAEAPRPSVPETALAGPAPAGRQTLLLVEDEDAVRAVLRAVLQKDGYAVLEASCPSDALRICERHEGPIHLLLTDVVMPQMSGRELAERVSVLRREIKTLYMSGYTAEAVANHGVLEAGMPFLEKPISPRKVTATVRELLDSPPPTSDRPHATPG
jgi:CheY-like chemotaxis protein